MMSKKRSRLNDNCVEAVDPSTPIKKQRQYLGSDLFNQMLLDELVIKIFSYFEYKDLLLAAALVCKRWENLSRDSDLWRSLDLSRLPCRFKIATKTVEKLLKHSKGFIHINLEQCRIIGDPVLSKIVRHKKKMLRTLILHDCRTLSDRWIGSIANCRSLQKLNLRNLQNLSDDALAMIAESCMNLIELNISNCHNITTKGLLPVIQHCTQLKCLEMYHCSVDDDFLIALATEQSQIESLDIAVCLFTDDGLQYLRKLPKLRRISVCLDNNLVSVFSNMIFLELFGDITNDGVSTIVRNNPNLEHLSFAWDKSIDNIALEIISKSPCQFTLIHLNVNGCSTSELGIIHILRNCVKLQSLTFSKIPEEIVNKWTIDYPHIKFCGFFLK